jgi:hypothetical protein
MVGLRGGGGSVIGGEQSDLLLILPGRKGGEEHALGGVETFCSSPPAVERLAAYLERSTLSMSVNLTVSPPGHAMSQMVGVPAEFEPVSTPSMTLNRGSGYPR